MDEWITVDRMDVTKLRYGKKRKERPDADGDGPKGKGQKSKNKNNKGGEDAKGKGKCGPKDEVDPHDDHHKPKNISKVYMGKYVVEPWYFSPYHYRSVVASFVCDWRMPNELPSYCLLNTLNPLHIRAPLP